MSQSRLSYKISLCQSIENLNDDGCFEVIRLLQRGSGCQDLNGFVIKLIMQMTQTIDVEIFTKMGNKIKEMVSNNNYTNSDSEKNIQCSKDVGSSNSNTSKTINHVSIITITQRSTTQHIIIFESERYFSF